MVRCLCSSDLLLQSKSFTKRVPKTSDILTTDVCYYVQPPLTLADDAIEDDEDRKELLDTNKAVPGYCSQCNYFESLLDRRSSSFGFFLLSFENIVSVQLALFVPNQ